MDGGEPVKVDLPQVPELESQAAGLDGFQAEWSRQERIPAGRLSRLADLARIRSVGASCRLAGVRLPDEEVAAILSGAAPERSAERAAALGYAAAMSRPPGQPGRLVSSDDLGTLHATMVGQPDTPSPSPWREVALHREAFDAAGRATGRVFATLPARLVPEKTEEALTWLEFELRSGERHAALVIGTFLLHFLAISPFQQGSVRMARLLAYHLLRRAGYTFLPYASLDARFEATREDWHRALDASQTRLWRGEADLEPWLRYFLGVVAEVRDEVDGKTRLEADVVSLPPLQQAILQAVREHGTVDAALLIKTTGANRNTLKDNLRRLVHRGVLERTGQRRGTRYLLATAAADLKGDLLL
jgi:Fic family protein